MDTFDYLLELAPNTTEAQAQSLREAREALLELDRERGSEIDSRWLFARHRGQAA